MPRTPAAQVEPALLIWARESLGLAVADAAKKLGVKPERLEQWEQGDAHPTVAQLRTAARVYKRPLAVFFLSEAPHDFDVLRDFRRLPDKKSSAWSPQLHTEFRRAREQRETTLELAQLTDQPIPSAPSIAHSIGEPEEFARMARGLLDVDLDDQFSWRDKYRALAEWIRAVEDVAVLVLQTGAVSLEEMRGFSIYANVLPAIVVNAKDSPRGRVFTVLHEFAHVLLNNGGLCDLSTDPRSEEGRIEIFCNRVAAAILLPEGAFSQEEVVHQAPDSYEGWSQEELRELADKYGVSQEVTLRRLLTLGKTSPAFYQMMRHQFLETYGQPKNTTGFAPYHRVRVRDLGKPYVRLVLEAYQRDEINASEVSDYLGVNLKHLPKITEEALRDSA